jgi:hypothetical protein
MELKRPKNENYAAIVVEIKTLVPLDKCDNVQAAIIMGNQVVVSKEVKVGDIGLFFPVETALSKEYLSANNLYRKPELNNDSTQKGYFEENGRIRCVKFRGHKSEGLFMPMLSIDFAFKNVSSYGFNLGDCFDELNNVPICSKYIVKANKTPGQPGSKKNKADKKYESKLVENQFRFHEDTSQLYRNIHKINPDDLISITYKLHGCVSEDTIINTDQGDFTIKFIVDNKLKVNIKAFDIETNQIVYVPIDEYYLLKNDGEWYEIELEDGTTLKITGNNPVWLPELNCYRKAELLNVSDVLLIAE